MITEGKFIFKSITARDGGEFTNQQGQVIKYQPAFKVKFDELVDGEPKERTINVSQDQVELIKELQSYKPYTTVIFGFDFGFNISGFYGKLISSKLAGKDTKEN